MKSVESQPKPHDGGWGAAVKFCVVLAVGFLGVGVYVAFTDWQVTHGHEAWGNPGVRGDFWGGHFAAASGFAGTLLFFAALLLQGKELKLQRQELAETRRVAQEQADSLSKQVAAMERQNAVVRRRNDIEVVSGLLDRVNTWIMINTTVSQAFTRIALSRIVDCAISDPQLADDLLIALAIMISRKGHNSMQMGWINEELAKAVHANAPELATVRDGTANLAWLVHAQKMVSAQ